MPCGREINDPPSPVLLHLARHPSPLPPPPPSSHGWSSRTSIPSVHGANPAVLLGHPASVAVTAAAILFHLRLPVPLPMSTNRSLASLSSPVVLHHPSATPCLLDQRPGDGTTRKAGFKIIMARAILITVAQTTTISGWHHHYKSVVRGAATPPTTTAGVRTLLLPIRLISHCTYRPLCEPAIDVRSELCKDTVAPKYI